MDDARRRLGAVTKNPAEYKQVMEKLIVQALYQVMEPVVMLRCRQADVGLVNEVLPQAVAQYKETIKQELTVNVDTDNHLSADTCGGVELIALNWRIKVGSVQHFDFNKCNLQKNRSVALTAEVVVLKRITRVAFIELILYYVNIALSY